MHASLDLVPVQQADALNAKLRGHLRLAPDVLVLKGGVRDCEQAVRHQIGVDLLLGAHTLERLDRLLGAVLYGPRPLVPKIFDERLQAAVDEWHREAAVPARGAITNG